MSQVSPLQSLRTAEHFFRASHIKSTCSAHFTASDDCSTYYASGSCPNIDLTPVLPCSLLFHGNLVLLS